MLHWAYSADPDVTVSGTWSGSTLYAQAFLSEYYMVPFSLKWNSHHISPDKITVFTLNIRTPESLITNVLNFKLILMLMFLKLAGWGKYCRPWLDTTFCGIWSQSTCCLLRPVCSNIIWYHSVWNRIAITFHLTKLLYLTKIFRHLSPLPQFP